ncbi:hypothetical protein EAI_17034 [Harpegnathos saltator]|uniref:Uncharacterized protein n=1 Tax=Harpegnathos saltator TaxID=610380 RepID=E2C887_HARSA|nr:hypothetical protein EAI_17034 [Harpegnathos saltator]
MFWNVAGVTNKDKGFWEGIKKWDVTMMETWMERKDWERIREKLPKEFRWKVQLAIRKNKKGRAKRGMLMGIRRGIEEEEEEEEEEQEEQEAYAIARALIKRGKATRLN